ncbi:MAG: DUF4198 domain-containing protein, partial [Planctomycetaceae bacterium]|nr:DUF4198 domain-containing protein [Planctomycetaceae bacterium]
PTVVATSHNWGVLQRGDLSFVLQYFAKTYHNAKPAEWSQIDSSTALKLDITPQLLDDQQVQLLVKWEGKPLANAELKVEDDQGDVELEGKTDAEGKFSFKAPADHIYSIRAKHVESKAGESDGKKYSEIRYYSTLALKL